MLVAFGYRLDRARPWFTSRMFIGFRIEPGLGELETYTSWNTGTTIEYNRTMNGMIEPTSTTVTLRGHVVAVDSDVGRAFALDCCRYVEELITEKELRSKYAITETAWQALETNEPLQLLVGKLKDERIRDGTAQREKGLLRWNAAIDVVHGIVQDPTAPSRARLDGARELRACAGAGAETNTPVGEKYVINISFASHKVHKVVDVKPIAREPLTIEPDEDDLPETRPTGLPIYTIRE
jgi:hypothetical protein